MTVYLSIVLKMLGYLQLSV